MLKNTAQLQKGLSLQKFFETHSTEQQCLAAFFKLRRLSGFICSGCGNTTYYELKGRKLYQSHKCQHRTSFTDGTIFENVNLPSNQWFLAIYLLNQHNTSLSAMQLSQDVGVSYNKS